MFSQSCDGDPKMIAGILLPLTRSSITVGDTSPNNNHRNKPLPCPFTLGAAPRELKTLNNLSRRKVKFCAKLYADTSLNNQRNRRVEGFEIAETASA